MSLFIQRVEFVAVLRRILTSRDCTNCALQKTLGQINR